MAKAKNSLVEDIVAQFYHRIFITKEYLPNTRIPNERDLAESLGVSRNSLREAIKLLEAKGVLIIERGIGTYVSSNLGVEGDPFGLLKIYDREKLLWDLFEVRLIFEPEVVHLAVERASDSEIEEIIACQRYGVEQVKNGEDFSLADKKFHLTIAKAAHNEVMERFIPSIHESINGIHKIYPSTLSEWWKKNLQDNFLESHNEIVRFIKLRDPIGAELAMRHHMLRTIKDLESIRNKT